PIFGGWLAARFTERWVAVAGMVIAAAGFWLLSNWPKDPLAARHDLGVIELPVLDTDLAVVGLGLGLVIAPLSSAVLRVVPAAQHVFASGGVGVAGRVGMLGGVAALTARGLHRFWTDYNQVSDEVGLPLGVAAEQAEGMEQRLVEGRNDAWLAQQHDMFW